MFGQDKQAHVLADNPEHGAFLPAMLLQHRSPHDAVAVHEVEAFGPVSTVMPYDELEEAVALANRGLGSLCCSITTHDPKVARDFVHNAAHMHGRILVLDRDCAKESTGHGSPMPLARARRTRSGWEAAKRWEACAASNTTCNARPSKVTPPCSRH